MPKILVNFKYNKKKDEYSLFDTDVVYADMPIALMELGAEYEEVLIVPINGQATVVEKGEFLARNKQFHLVADGEMIVEDKERGTPVWLPKDTNLTELRYINGQILKVENKTEVEEEVEGNAQEDIIKEE